MANLLCAVYDPNNLSREIMEGFVHKTAGLTLISQHAIEKADIIFIDADLDKRNLAEYILLEVHIIIFSSNTKYINSLFSNQITDYLFKPDLTYERFLRAIKIVKEDREITSAPHTCLKAS